MKVSEAQPERSVSVITVAKDAAATLPATIASVLEQTGVDVEYIIIDGGSDDGSKAILECFEEHVDIIVSEPDDGIADAMNKGLSLAHGEWILFLGADDRFMSSTSLADLFGHATRCGADILSGSVLIEQTAGEAVRLDPRGFDYRANFKTPLLHQGALCRRRVFSALGGFDTSLTITMDYDFFLRAYRAGEQVCVVDELVAVMGAGGIGSRTDWPVLQRRFREEQWVRLRHCESVWLRLFFRVLFVCYLGYRRWLRPVLVG